MSAATLDAPREAAIPAQSPAPLTQALAWWATRDDMGGFRAVGRELFPGWTPGHGACRPPHRDDKLPTFSIRSNAANQWYFKDWESDTTGSLAAFVMLSGMDAGSANYWLIERWGLDAPQPGEPARAITETRNGNGEASTLVGTASPPSQTENSSSDSQTPMHTQSFKPLQGVLLNGDSEDAVPTITNAVALQPPGGGGPPDSLTASSAPEPPRRGVSFTTSSAPKSPSPAADAVPWIASLGEAIVSSHELQTMELQPRPRLLGDWFCEGDLGFIYAFRGVGKTWLAMLMARALTEGGRLGEWQAHAPARVLYVDGEMPPDLMRQRDKGLARDGGGQLEFLNHEILFRRTHRVMNITDIAVQQGILEYCESSGVKVLILDNLSTLASGMKENDADDWEMVGRWLLDFRRRQIAVIVIHHAGRNGEMRGTTKREDDAGWIIALDDARQAADDRRGARFITRFSKQTRNTPEVVPPYEWHISPDLNNGSITVSHTPASGLDMLRKLVESGITECSELAEELGVSKGTISKWAHRAIAEGWLIKEGRCYVLQK